MTKINKRSIVVLGSINMDIVAISERLPNAGETIIGSDLKYFPGGKGANQAIAASKLGAETYLIGKVGMDKFGQELTSFIESQGVRTYIGTTELAPTGVALISVSSNTSENTIVVIPGANFQITPQQVEEFNLFNENIILSQFEVPTNTIISIFKKGKGKNSINILNPAPAKMIPPELLELTDILVLNETELSVITSNDINIADENSILGAIKKIPGNVKVIIVTLGVKGLLAISNSTIIRIDGIKVKAIDTTGAGDCFIGAISASLSQGSSIESALKFANKAASICVTRLGAGSSMPTIDEVTNGNSSL